MKRRSRILLAVVMILFAGIAVLWGAYGYVSANLEKLAAVSISNADLSKIEDGTYSGSYKVFPVAAEVRVTIKNRRITGIELVKHNNGQGAPAEVIPAKVAEAQSLEVDVVSGATYSSKVILKAIENALNSAGNGEKP